MRWGGGCRGIWMRAEGGGCRPGGGVTRGEEKSSDEEGDAAGSAEGAVRGASLATSVGICWKGVTDCCVKREEVERDRGVESREG